MQDSHALSAVSCLFHVAVRRCGRSPHVLCALCSMDASLPEASKRILHSCHILYVRPGLCLQGLKHSPSQQAVLQALTKQGSQGRLTGTPSKPGSGHCRSASSGSVGPLMDLSSEQVSADNTPLLSAAAAVGLLDEVELRKAAPIKSIRQSLSLSAVQQQQGKAEPLSV